MTDLKYTGKTISRAMGITPGITAVIGSGGKSSLISRLAGEISENVIICTTTHILKPEEGPLYIGDSSRIRMPLSGMKDINMDPDHEGYIKKETDALKDFLSGNRQVPVCVGMVDGAEPSKLTGYPVEIIRRAADKEAYIFIEADGSRHMSLKAHRENEPVIPKETDRVILVIGAEGIGKKISEAVHRPEIFCDLAEADMDAVVDTGILVRVLKKERHKFGNCRMQILLNRTVFPEEADTDTEQGGLTEKDIENAEKIAVLTGWEVFAGCVNRGEIIQCG